ncbi:MULTISPECIES: TolC family protein [Clostridium]|uniref:Viral A-type inclusion protein n=1 Tax=Clostridium botulinum (strain Eklund 17B / Type B) TaxID=935198 RepID=B2TP65_CLOBB|nr:MULTISPECIES: TolC family protein [Clostridium]ACD24579.1 putative viral A-type inclusion protein [Clostridium botulinum B str. Eklund 17B (NRP)]MBN1046272.1 viral A-type inclusion protein [Clostridium botulinum]MBN1052964.1 viral A-type inclusion protein [Clostridium botulinum]MBN1056171.1 viral A-type inclusion protein [Clostridium botulinum]MBY6976329.1 TolC family protein [Clostridium botulinum]
MKRITGILLLLFVFMNQISVQAATRENIQLSMENIEEIITEYSPDLKIMKNNLKRDKEKYKDILDEVDDKESEVSSLENQINNYKPEVKPEEQPKSSNEKEDNTLDSLKKDLNNAKDKLDSLKDEKQAAKHNLKVSNIRYEKDLQGLIESAQRQYIQYVDTLLKKELKQYETNFKNKQVEINNIKYGNGFISKKEYEKNLDDITDFNNELKEIEVKEKNELKDLLFSLGVPSNTGIKVDTNIKGDLDKISKINFEEDLDDMLLNNIDLKIKDIENDKVKDDSDISDYEIKNNKISLRQEEEKVKIEFQKRYNNLILSSNLLKASNDKLSRTQDDALIMQTKYNYGFASKKQVDELEVGLNNKNQDFISQVNNLYMDYLSYMKMKDGY